MSNDEPHYTLPPPSPWQRTVVTPEQTAAAQAAQYAQVLVAIEARKQREAAQKAEQERRERERAEAALEAHMESAKARFLAAGGKPDEWAKVRDRVKEQYLVQRALGPDERARTIEATKEQLRASGRYGF